jgi:hypothetical protein
MNPEALSFNSVPRHETLPSPQPHSNKPILLQIPPVVGPIGTTVQTSRWINPQMVRRNPNKPNDLRHMPSPTPWYHVYPIPEYTLEKWGEYPGRAGEEAITPWAIEKAKEWSWVGPREFISEALNGLPVRLPDTVPQATIDFPIIDRPYLSPNLFGTLPNLTSPVAITDDPEYLDYEEHYMSQHRDDPYQYAENLDYADQYESQHHDSSQQDDSSLDKGTPSPEREQEDELLQMRLMREREWKLWWMRRQSFLDDSSPQENTSPSTPQAPASPKIMQMDLATAQRLHEESKSARRFSESDDDIFCPIHLRNDPIIYCYDPKERERVKTKSKELRKYIKLLVKEGKKGDELVETVIEFINKKI